MKCVSFTPLSLIINLPMFISQISVLICMSVKPLSFTKNLATMIFCCLVAFFRNCRDLNLYIFYHKCIIQITACLAFLI